MVKEILENAKKQIEAQRTQQLNTIAQKVKVEKITPYNSELDKKRDKAIAEEREKANALIAQVQADCNAKIVEIQKATDENKKSYEVSCIQAASAEINVVCDAAISALNKQISETKE